MSNDNEFEIELDGVDSSNEHETSSIEIDLDEESNDNSSLESKKSEKDKNESNFKALYKSNKEKERLLAEERSRREALEEELAEWRNLNPDIAQSRDNNVGTEDLYVKVFTLENPEAKAYIEEIRNTAKTYNLPIEKAWKLVKADIPAESKSTSDFDFKSAPVKMKKSVKDISPEEALKLSPAQQSAWRKYHLGVD